MSRGKRFGAETLPQPVAVAWHAVERALPDDVRAATCAQFAVEVTLRTLCGLLLAEPPPQPRALSKTLRSAAKGVDKRTLGVWGALVAGFAEAAIAEPRDQAAYAPLRAAVGRWLLPGGERGDAWQAQAALIDGRNARSHGGASNALDIGMARAYLEQAAHWLASLRWLGDWQIVVLTRLDQPQPGPVLRSRAIRLVGRELAPVPQPVAWTAASAPWGEPILVAPGEGALLTLARTCRINSSATTDILEVPLGFRDGRIEVAAQDASKSHVIGAEPATGVLTLGTHWLPNHPQPERLTSVVPRPGERATAAAHAAAAARSGSASSAGAPQGNEADTRSRTRSGGGLLLAAALLAAAGGGLWAYSTASPTQPTLTPSPVPTQPTQPTQSAPDAAAIPATATVAVEEADVAAAVDPLAFAREALARCAAAPAAEDDPQADGGFDDAVGLLRRDEPRDAEAAHALSAVLDVGTACGDRLALQLAKELRPRQLGLREGDADRLLERARVLAREVAQRGSTAQRDPAGLLAASAALQMHDAIDGRGMVDDPRQERRLQALLEDAGAMVCAVLDRQAQPDVVALRTALGEEPFRTVAFAETTPRICAMQLLEGDEDLAARRRWLMLAEDGPRCCSTAPAAECGEPIRHCEADIAVFDRALALCREVGAPIEARIDACEQALDLAERALKVRAALPAIDPRCLPRWAAPDDAARAVAAMRRSPAPDPAKVAPRRGHLPPKPQHDAAVGRWLAAVRAHGELVTSLSRQEPRRETLRAEARLHAIKAAKTLFALAYLPSPAGERPCPSRPPEVVPESLRGVVWDPRRLLRELEKSTDPSVRDEAKALSCRAEAADGEADAVRDRHGERDCPP
ncbi:MAG: hypothetical protein H6747_01740 [Deltaproteobacteria bacterium]|nr:hypothetical protein [Deltaproteobacteria bacterium]